MYQKKGYPKKREIIIGTVTRVLPHSVFVNLNEYKNLEGMIHTSEIERRLVRNLKSFFKEGRKLVCTVIDVNPSKEHINLSLKRVGSSQKRTKEKEWKNEKKADEILHAFAKMNKLKIEEVYKKFADKILEKYGLLYPAFEEIARGNENILKNIKIDSKIKKKALDLISKRITIPTSKITKTVQISCYCENGVEVIKKAFELAEEHAKKKNIKFKVLYAGAPNYKITIETENKKEINNHVEEILDIVEKHISKNKGKFKLK